MSVVVVGNSSSGEIAVRVGGLTRGDPSSYRSFESLICAQVVLSSSYGLGEKREEKRRKKNSDDLVCG